MLFVPPVARIVVLLAGIHGIVRSADGRGPAAGVHVELDGVDRATTDSAGRYAVADLDTGLHRLRFLGGGYEIRLMTVLLADSSDLALDVELTPRPVVLPPIDVVARATGDFETDFTATTGSHEPGEFRFASGWQTSQPAGGVDIQQAIARVPGVATRGDNATALSIHGARGSESLLLLDGIPLFGAVHFASASSAVNPDAVSTIDLHTGVSSARFGGALSGVVNLETADVATGSQTSVGLSTADARTTMRTPLGAGGGLVVSVRSSFRNLLTDASGLGAGNGYEDVLTAARMPLGRGMLRIVGFGSTNRLRWESSGADPLRNIDGAAGLPTSPANDAALWRSGAIGATWTQPLEHQGEWRAAVWWTGSAATVATRLPDQIDLVNSSIGEFGVSTSWRRGLRTGNLQFGAELSRPQTWYASSTSSTAADANHSGIALSAAPALGSWFGEWTWRAAPRIDVRAGLRAGTDFRRSSSFDPRLVVNFRPDADTRIELGFGRTHQYLQSMLNEENLMSAVIGPPLLTATPDAGRPASADQWVASLTRRLAAGVTVAVDAYIRRWQDVLVPAATSTGFFVLTAPAYSAGAARGASATVSIVRGNVTLRGSAAAAASGQRGGDGISYPSNFERPWSFSGDLNYRLAERTTLLGQWGFGAGQQVTAMQSGIEWRPYQPATGAGEIEGAVVNLPRAGASLRRLPGQVRLDLGIRREWRFGTSSRSIGIVTALRLENLFNQADALGIMARSDGGLQILRGTPRGLVVELGWVH